MRANTVARYNVQTRQTTVEQSLTFPLFSSPGCMPSPAGVQGRILCWGGQTQQHPSMVTQSGCTAADPPNTGFLCFDVQTRQTTVEQNPTFPPFSSPGCIPPPGGVQGQILCWGGQSQQHAPMVTQSGCTLTPPQQQAQGQYICFDVSTSLTTFSPQPLFPPLPPTGCIPAPPGSPKDIICANGPPASAGPALQQSGPLPFPKAGSCSLPWAPCGMVFTPPPQDPPFPFPSDPTCLANSPEAVSPYICYNPRTGVSYEASLIYPGPNYRACLPWGPVQSGIPRLCMTFGPAAPPQVTQQPVSPQPGGPSIPIGIPTLTQTLEACATVQCWSWFY